MIDCRLTVLILCLIPLKSYSQQVVSGKVCNAKKEPIEFSNVYLLDTLEGSSTDGEGIFLFETNYAGEATLIVSVVGYKKQILVKDIASMRNLTIILQEDASYLHEVLIESSILSNKHNSTMQELQPLDVVSGAGTNADLIKSISFLPGVQAAGINGKLLVRGGDDSETETYIDDMHVLAPISYPTTSGQARSRYSPFFFSGINFSAGGYSSEYSQSLSSLLPLYTVDGPTKSKLGLNLMNVSLGLDGAKVWEKQSYAFSVSYLNLGLNNKVFYPKVAQLDIRPYNTWAVSNQYVYKLNNTSQLKVFMLANYSTFKQLQEIASGSSGERYLRENYFYLNSTYTTQTASQAIYFLGVALGLNQLNIQGARQTEDQYKTTENEVHIKGKRVKRYNNFYKLALGLEYFNEAYKLSYITTTQLSPQVNYQIFGAYHSHEFNLSSQLLFNPSLRVEYTSSNKSLELLPRVSLNYKLKNLSLTASLGKYQQLSSKDYLLYEKKLKNQVNWNYQIGMIYQHKDKILRCEFYYKDYRYLPLGSPQKGYESLGFGSSRGVDFYLKDQSFHKYWDYAISYTFNDSKRKYLDYPYAVQPDFATRHNASFSLSYTNWNYLKSKISLSHQWASGRPYNNPNETDFMNQKTPVLSSSSLSWTFVVSSKLIIYTSVSNLFNRKNVYTYTYQPSDSVPDKYNRTALQFNQNRSFYLGVFISLGRTSTYNKTDF